MSQTDIALVDPASASADPTEVPTSTLGVPAPRTAQNGAVSSPLRSQETFDAYCAQVQSRLAEHAALRRSFLQSAHERLTRLLHTARAVEDTTLYGELWQYRVAAQELLESLKQIPQAQGVEAPSAPPSGSWPTYAPPAKPRPLDHNEVIRPGGPISSMRPDMRPDMRPGMMPRPASAIGGAEAWGPPRTSPDQAIVTTRLPRRPVRPLADIEEDAMRLREETREWNSRWPLRTRAGDLDVPNCLRLRALACRQRRLEEEAGDTEVAEVTDLAKDIVAVMEAAGDNEYTVALDHNLEPHPTAYQWGEMAERYLEMARAQEAFIWWIRHRGMLQATEAQPLAEAIAAVQQRFNRLLFRIGARDPFQQQLFDELRTWAREAQCYLHSLRPKVPMVELIERASTLEAAWQNARQPIAEEELRRQAVDNVIALVGRQDFGTDPEHDADRLRAAVWECCSMQVASTDRRLREALLPWASLLEGDDRFKDVLGTIHLEWERRQEMGWPEEAGALADADLDALSAELEAVRALTRGKRCLVIGGLSREESRRKLEETLELGELVWPVAGPSDSLSSFEEEIRASDIVALMTRFSRQEWHNAAEICEREGKTFVPLHSGQGIEPIVRQFHEKAGTVTPAPTTRGRKKQA
ncbi:MAG TPA: hypothetical protein VFA07_13980 [Chthonomonadaceae bacterium]|nr:hypothetical protein [Chthonomonadaceae bacterium]